MEEVPSFVYVFGLGLVCWGKQVISNQTWVFYKQILLQSLIFVLEITCFKIQVFCIVI